MGLGKEKRMFTAIRSSYLYLESLKNAALDYEKEWGFSFVYSDKNKLEGEYCGDGCRPVVGTGEDNRIHRF